MCITAPSFSGMMMCSVVDLEKDGFRMGGDGKIEIGDGEKSGYLSSVEEARPNPGLWQVAGEDEEVGLAGGAE